MSTPDPSDPVASSPPSLRPNPDGEARFAARDGLGLYECWWDARGRERGVVAIVHGLAEHGRRYAHVADTLARAGFAVHALDQRGHGRSEGVRGHIDRIESLLDDAEDFVDRVRLRHPEVPLFLLGHSGGGTVVTLLCLTRSVALDGLVLSAPALAAGEGISKALIGVARILSRVTPRLPVQKLDATAVSRDPAVVEAYVEDPLVRHGAIRARMGAELLDAFDRIEGAMGELALPVLVMHGTADRLTDPRGSRLLHERARSADKTLRIYDGLYHEIFNEPERDRVLADLTTWLEAHSAGGTAPVR